MMPFISEELYQKLPNFEGKGESICISQYPLENPAFVNPTIESDFNTINAISKTIRSLTASVNLPNGSYPACYAIIQGDKQKELADLIKAQTKMISTLSKISSIEVKSSETEIPAGCIPNGVGNQLVVYVNVKEYLDVKSEISRQEKKLAEVEKMHADAIKKTKIPNYEKKVPEAIQIAQKEKIEKLTGQAEILKEIIQTLRKF